LKQIVFVWGASRLPFSRSNVHSHAFRTTPHQTLSGAKTLHLRMSPHAALPQLLPWKTKHHRRVAQKFSLPSRQFEFDGEGKEASLGTFAGSHGVNKSQETSHFASFFP
jgi:hypothetical protein